MKKALASLFLSLIRICTRKLVIKLILLFTSIIILAVSTLTFISYKMLEKQSVESNLAGSTNNLRLVNKNVRNYIGEVSQFTSPQYRYEQIMNALRNESDDTTSRMYLEDYLRVLFYSRTDVEGIFLYLIDENKVYTLTSKDITVKTSYNDTIPNEPWFKMTLADKKNRYAQSLLENTDIGYGVNSDQVFIASHRVLRDLVDRKPRAILSMVMNSSYRDEMVKDSSLKEGEDLLLLDMNMVPYYASDQPTLKYLDDAEFRSHLLNLPQGGQFTWSDGIKKYMAIVDVEKQEGWRMIKLLPYVEIYKAAQTNRNLSYSIGAVLLFFSILLIMLTVNAITKPIKILTRKMRRFSEGNFDVEMKVKGMDEVAYLSDQFNLMVLRTGNLINEKYKMKLVQNSAILKALEAEINPHFLYNALQAISTKALKSGVEDITEMVDALALTLRYCIGGKEFVLLKEEIEHIENYMLIQKARFGKRLLIVYDLEDEWHEFEIPRLTLQSLVENSVKHAVEKADIPVTIVIAARMEGQHMVIRVTDNGPGMNADRLKQVRSSLLERWEDRHGDSIGLKNVNTRLELLYGDEAGIEINSDESGTETRMMMPRKDGGTIV
ncbi:sensor histidine kinase [Cohnella nanjingensis]|uniref:histidine kinase n=1 Tax=Cohnella nanjingensis TaxID=1387779 RepID=A0A7X0VE93_9BACL|nr:histidine kinase [Cohnella nanjingensis]MBB6670043.1 histidine kinase [Cohnella nanjingensis]